jgi:hypothetical protein
MDDVILEFVMIPGYICLVGLIFALVFGSSIYRALSRQYAVQKVERQRMREIQQVEFKEGITGYEELSSRSHERELVHH